MKMSDTPKIARNLLAKSNVQLHNESRKMIEIRLKKDEVGKYRKPTDKEI